MSITFYILKSDTTEPYESWPLNLAVFTNKPEVKYLLEFMVEEEAITLLKEGYVITKDGVDEGGNTFYGEELRLEEVEGVYL